MAMQEMVGLLGGLIIYPKTPYRRSSGPGLSDRAARVRGAAE